MAWSSPRPRAAADPAPERLTRPGRRIEGPGIHHPARSRCHDRRVLRKRPCACGSGRPARDCCGRFRRVAERDAALAYLARQARQARDLIGPFSPAALAGLQREAATLPDRCDAFTAALRMAKAPVGADLRRLARAMSGARRGALEVALAGADSPQARVAVAKALVALREAGSVDEHLAAAALVGLVAPRSALTEAALLVAAGTLAGEHEPATAWVGGRTAPA